MYVKSYFWRTYNGVELDYIEKKTNELFAYEIKYNKPKLKAPKSWVDNYGSNYQCITKESVLGFLL